MNARRLLATTTAVAVAVAAWLLLAPARIGGAATYVTTHGISMEPRFHTGDLAVLRPAEHYRVGDIVGYRSTVMHTVVMHRIVAIAGGRYTFKGDNNAWLDPERPTRDRLIGALVLRIPHGGTWLARGASPAGLALVAFALSLAGTTTAQTQRLRRRRKLSRHAAPRTHGSRASMQGLSSALRTAPLIVSVTGLLAVGLAAFAWTTPVNTTRAVNVPQATSLTFGYSATVPKTAAYDGTTASSPDPIFRRVANTVDVHYGYRGRPATVTLRAQLTAASGWHSTVMLSPSSPIRDGDKGDVTLDLRRLDARARAAAAVIGAPFDQVGVNIVADITSTTDDFKPTLPLTLTPFALSLRGDPKQLTVSHRTSRLNRLTVPRRLGVAGRQLDVRLARDIALGLLVATIVAAATLAVSARRVSKNTEAEYIRRRYGDTLVLVQPVSSPPGRPLVDVAGFPALLRIAERYGLLILHWSRSGVDTFMVEDEGASYRYRIVAGGLTTHGGTPPAHRYEHSHPSYAESLDEIT